MPPHGASRLVQAMSVWSVKTRHAPSRHCRDARVYGHTTTAMHDIEYLSPIEYTPPLLAMALPPSPVVPAQLQAATATAASALAATVASSVRTTVAT